MRGRSAVPGFEVPPGAGIGLPTRGSSDDGVQLGVGRDGEPVRVQVFGEEVGRIGAVLAVPDLVDLFAGVIAGGARVVVVTARPALWQVVAGVLGGPSLLQVLPPNSAVPGEATFAHPLLVVRDTYLVTPPNRMPVGPWRTVLTVVPVLGPATAPAVRGSQLYLVRRLAEPETRYAVTLLGIPTPAADVLAAVPEGHLAVLTDDELKLVGPARSPGEQARYRTVAQAMAPAVGPGAAQAGPVPPPAVPPPAVPPPAVPPGSAAQPPHQPR